MSERVIGIHVCAGEQRRAELRRVGTRLEVVRLECQPISDLRSQIPDSKGDAASQLEIGNRESEVTVVASLPPADVLIRHWNMPAAEPGVLRQMAAHRLEAELPIPLAEMVWHVRPSSGSPSPGRDGSLAVGPASARDDILSEDSPSSGSKRWRAPATTAAGGVRVVVQAARAGQVQRHLSRYTALPAGGGGSGSGSKNGPASLRPAVALTTEAEAIRCLYRYGLRLDRGAEHPPPRADDSAAPPAEERVNAALAGGAEVLVLASPREWLVAVLEADAVLALRRVRRPLNGSEAASRECEQLVGAEVPLHDLRRIVWCGGLDSASAADVLGRRLGVPVVAAEAADRLADAGGQAIPAERLAAYGPAIGLALAGLHEPGELVRFDRAAQTEEAQPPLVERLLAHPWRWTAVAAALLVIALGLHMGRLSWEAGRMETGLAAAAGAEAGDDADLAWKLLAVERLEKYRIPVEDTTAALVEVLPDGVILSSLQLSRERRLTIKGKANDFKALFTFADGLRKSPHFASVSPERTEGGGEPNQPGGSFTITADLAQVEKLTSLAGRGGRWR